MSPINSKFELLLASSAEAETHHLELTSLSDSTASHGKVKFLLNGEPGEADWARSAPGIYSLLIDGRSYRVRVFSGRDSGSNATPSQVNIAGRTYRVEIRDPRRRRYLSTEAGGRGPQEIYAPMPGRIVRLLVSENQGVRQNQGLLVIEAMKMQNELKAPRSGRVERIYVSEGAGVETGAKLVRLG